MITANPDIIARQRSAPYSAGPSSDQMEIASATWKATTTSSVNNVRLSAKRTTPMAAARASLGLLTWEGRLTGIEGVGKDSDGWVG